MQFDIGQRVTRREDRVATGAAVLEVVALDGEEPIYRIDYDEGGHGWWPESALAAA